MMEATHLSEIAPAWSGRTSVGFNKMVSLHSFGLASNLQFSLKKMDQKKALSLGYILSALLGGAWFVYSFLPYLIAVAASPVYLVLVFLAMAFILFLFVKAIKELLR